MKTNLAPYIEKEINYFVQKFASIGWKLEDDSYLVRPVNFIVNPNSANEEWKKQFSMVLYPELLSYKNNYKEDKKVYGECTTVWTRCRISIDSSMIHFDNVTGKPDFYKSKVIDQIIRVIKEDLKKIGYKPFMDEDAFRNNFTQPEYIDNLHAVEFSFFLNYHYPQGWWENHTLSD